MKNAIIDTIIETMTGMTNLSLDAVSGSKDEAVRMSEAVCGSPIFGSISGVAVSLCVLFILIHLVEETMQGKSDPEYLIKSIGFYCVICAIIINMDTFTTSLIDVFKGILDTINSGKADLIKMIQNGAETSTFDPEVMRTQLEGKNIIVLIFNMLLYWIFGSLGTMIVTIIVDVVAYTLELTVMVETFILPLALAQLPEGGWNGIGGKAIRTYFASWLAFGIIDVILGCYQILLGKSMGNSFDFVVTLFAASFACIGMAMKANNVAKEIVT